MILFSCQELHCFWCYASQILKCSRKSCCRVQYKCISHLHVLKCYPGTFPNFFYIIGHPDSSKKRTTNSWTKQMQSTTAFPYNQVKKQSNKQNGKIFYFYLLLSFFTFCFLALSCSCVFSVFGKWSINSVPQLSNIRT